jgi:hypothetical protein
MKRAIPLATAALGAALLAAFLAPPVARGDELKLKDGTKITGTIVGYEENSFKVQTSYGFAIVQKDQVVSISIADTAKAAPEKKLVADAEKAPSAKPAKKEKANAAAPEATGAKTPASAVEASTPAATPTPATAVHAPAPSQSPTAPAATETPSAVAASAPPQPAAPEPIREEVSGNIYTNGTYGFQMYKPPDWQVIEGARSILPGAIAAMGTDDQTTYLLIGQQPTGKSLASEMDATDARLRAVMDNFRALGETSIKVSGGTAIERRFRGSVDQHDWSGTVVFVPRGSRLYTIFGMTIADSDLVQIQENVIARAISSLQFSQ